MWNFIKSAIAGSKIQAEPESVAIGQEAVINHYLGTYPENMNDPKVALQTQKGQSLFYHLTYTARPTPWISYEYRLDTHELIVLQDSHWIKGRK